MLSYFRLVKFNVVVYYFMQAVRIMKTSPLSAEEIARIQEVNANKNFFELLISFS
jgi:hypothetical protein